MDLSSAIFSAISTSRSKMPKFASQRADLEPVLGAPFELGEDAIEVELANARQRGRAPVAERAAVGAPTVGLEVQPARAAAGGDEAVVDPEQDGRRDLVEVGDAVARGGPNHAIAVAERKARYVREHREIGWPVTDVTTQRIEEVGEGGLALAVHRDVDVGVVGEVPLGIRFVLGCVGPTVDRDVVGVQLLEQRRMGEVGRRRPDVVGEQVDAGSRSDLLEPGAIPEQSRPEVEGVLEVAFPVAPSGCDEHAERSGQAREAGVEADDRHTIGRTATGVVLGLETVELLVHLRLTPHAVAHRLSVARVSRQCGVVVFEPHQHAASQQPTRESAELIDVERVGTQLVGVASCRVVDGRREPEHRGRRELQRVELGGHGAVVVAELEPARPTADQDRRRQGQLQVELEVVRRDAGRRDGRSGGRFGGRFDEQAPVAKRVDESDHGLRGRFVDVQPGPGKSLDEAKAFEVEGDLVGAVVLREDQPDRPNGDHEGRCAMVQRRRFHAGCRHLSDSSRSSSRLQRALGPVVVAFLAPLARPRNRRIEVPRALVHDRRQRAVERSGTDPMRVVDGERRPVRATEVVQPVWASPRDRRPGHRAWHDAT